MGDNLRQEAQRVTNLIFHGCTTDFQYGVAKAAIYDALETSFKQGILKAAMLVERYQMNGQEMEIGRDIRRLATTKAAGEDVG